MKKISVLISLLFIVSFSSKAIVQIIEVNQACSTPEYEIPDSPVDACQLFNGNVLGQFISIDALAHPIITDGMNNIVNDGRYLGFGFENQGWEAYFFNDFITAKGYAAGDLIDGTPGAGPDSQIAIVQYEQFPFGSVLGDPGSLYQTSEFYLGFYLFVDGQKHYGWMQWDYDFSTGNFGLRINSIGIETIPNHPIVAGQGASYIIEGPYSAIGSIYLDDNANGVFDLGELEFPNAQLNLDAMGYSILNYTTTNPFNISMAEGTYSVSSSFDSDIWSISGLNAYSFTLNSGNPSQTELYFGLIQNGIQEEIEGTIIPQTARCNEIRTHTLNLNNTGNVISSGYLTYEFDALCSFISSYPAPDSIVDHTLFFSYNSLNYFSQSNYEIQFQMPSEDFIGENLLFDVNVFNDQGALLSQNQKVLTVACAYDPNDKTEFNGYTENGFILPGQELEYLIRFQNTGNDTAYNVLLIDQLSPLLDFATFEAKSASHNHEVTLLESGELYINFENIFLPDSTTNLEESQGFFSFSISALDNLSEGDTIENTAEIYFDFNPPIITNTTTNSIFSCDDLAQFVSPTEVCSGELFEASSTASFVEDYTWLVEGIEIGNESNLLYEFESPGDYWMIFSAENPLCQNLDSILISVLETPIANAGIDTSFCGIEGNLQAENNGYSGFWSSTTDVDIETAEQYQSTIFVDGQGSHELVWTSTNGMCESSDTVQVAFYEIPWVEISETDGILYANTFGDNYQWYYNGEAIPGATEESYSPSENGEYTVTVEGQNDCIGESEIYEFIIDALFENEEFSFHISPNPFIDFFWFEINIIGEIDFEIEILDQAGRIVRREVLTQKQIKIERNNLSSGTYILNLKSPNGQILKSEKLILK